MQELLDFITENPDIVGVGIAALLAHFGASSYVATTATKAGKVYKIIEAVALATKKAKSEAASTADNTTGKGE